MLGGTIIIAKIEELIVACVADGFWWDEFVPKQML
jgi:hypothetical protein